MAHSTVPNRNDPTDINSSLHNLLAWQDRIQQDGMLIVRALNILHPSLRLGDDGTMSPSVCAARMTSQNCRYHRELRAQLCIERGRLSERYNAHDLQTDLGHSLLDVAGDVRAASDNVHASWELLSHLYDNFMMYLTDGERVDMDAAIADISSCKVDLDAKATKIASDLDDWMPCFSIILPEAAFQACLSTLFRRPWSSRELKRLARPILYELGQLSTENTMLLEQNIVYFRAILVEWCKTRFGDVMTAELFCALEAYTSHQPILVSSLDLQMKTVMALDCTLRAARLNLLTIRNVNGVPVTIERLQQAFTSYEALRSECECFIQTCSSLEKKLTATIELLKVLSPLELRVDVGDRK